MVAGRGGRRAPSLGVPPPAAAAPPVQGCLRPSPPAHAGTHQHRGGGRGTGNTGRSPVLRAAESPRRGRPAPRLFSARPVSRQGTPALPPGSGPRPCPRHPAPGPGSRANLRAGTAEPGRRWHSAPSPSPALGCVFRLHQCVWNFGIIAHLNLSNGKTSETAFNTAAQCSTYAICFSLLFITE